MEPKVIYEDEHLIVLDKPAGWIVNEADTTKDTPVVQSWLKKNFNYPIVGDRALRSGIVHRLDKDTSGVLLIAKTANSFRNLQQQFKVRVVEKTYLALVHGKVEPEIGEIKAPVGRLPWNRERFGVLPGGRESETHYKVIGYYKFTNTIETFSLVEFYPKTGRTHQIRIHSKYLGNPIVSDSFYAGRKTSRNDRKWCSRTFLHAAGIVFDHPKTKKKISFDSELPDELANALNSLEKLH